jgi:tRNA dimethylallyltransferase
VDLATRFNGEIINGDAMQMYRGLPIITNKIPVEERNGIPHHLIDRVSLEEEPWRISTFRKETLRLIKEIHSRGKLPILVGGTHYYTQSVLFDDAVIDEGEEEEQEEEMRDLQRKERDKASPTAEDWSILDAPTEVMLQKLREVDPVMADRWHPNETRKIRRSLQIYLQTGKPATEIYEQQRRQRLEAGMGSGDDDGDNLTQPGRMRYQTLLFWTHAAREKLYKRLDARVDAMVQQGLIAEAQMMSDYVKEQESQGVTVDQTRGVWISIGLKELEPYFAALRAGLSNEEELAALRQSCIESVKTTTRHYSAKQIKWIRNKLWNALAEVDAAHRLYILDSNVEDWEKCVTEPSERVVHAFLSNERCPDPKTLSELARETLDAREKEHQKKMAAISAADSPSIFMKQLTCDLCHKTMMGQEQWDIHVRGSGHKRALKAAAKRAQRDEYLRSRESSEDATKKSD